MRPLKILFFPQDSKIIKDSFCSAISNQITLFQMKMIFFPEKHLKILRNFRGTTNKQNSWVGRTHCCSVPTFCFPFCAVFLTSTFSQTQRWRGLIQPITSEVSRSLWQQFYMCFFSFPFKKTFKSSGVELLITSYLFTYERKTLQFLENSWRGTKNKTRAPCFPFYSQISLCL